MFRKKLSSDYADLTIGRVYYKELTNGLVSKATKNSTIYGDVMNNEMFFSIIEQGLISLSKKKLRNLTVQDGNKVRNKIKEILTRHGLMSSEFSKEDSEWFEQSGSSMVNEFKKRSVQSVGD